jgi:hypothetical protein
MSEHNHMDITEQANTYNLFTTLVKYCCIGIAVVLIIMAATLV